MYIINCIKVSKKVSKIPLKNAHIKLTAKIL